MVLAGCICNGSRVGGGGRHAARHGPEILSLERRVLRGREGSHGLDAEGVCFPDLDSTKVWVPGLERERERGCKVFCFFGAAPAASRARPDAGEGSKFFCPLWARLPRICAKFGRARLHVTD